MRGRCRRPRRVQYTDVFLQVNGRESSAVLVYASADSSSSPSGLERALRVKTVSGSSLLSSSSVLCMKERQESTVECRVPRAPRATFSRECDDSYG